MTLETLTLFSSSSSPQTHPQRTSKTASASSCSSLSALCPLCLCHHFHDASGRPETISHPNPPAPSLPTKESTLLMLAVQHPPRMGSSQPEPDPLLMFGYSVDTSQDNPFDGAPEPAPGAPLLTETDSKFLSSFFQDMTSNQYNMPSFGEGLNFSDAWLDLPPQFMGSSTSFGPQEDSTADFGFSNDQHGDLARMLSAGSSMMPPPPPPPPPQAQAQAQAQAHAFHPSQQQQQQQQQHSDDVLNAAATLLSNGSRNGSSSANSNGSSLGHTHTDQSDSSRRHGGYSIGQLRHQPIEEFKEENRRSSLGADPSQTFARWMWRPKERMPVTKPAMVDYQWGSDASFTDVQGYVPELTKDSVESMHQQQMKYLGCLEVKHSAANSRSGSPVQDGRATSINGDGSVALMKPDEDVNAPPRKRRKSKIVHSTTAEVEQEEEQEEDEEAEEDDDDTTTTKSGRKRKSKSERSASGSEPPSDTTAPGRRRKSGVSGSAKPPRENLSEEQKRENHIRSEQKRRTLIKEGFDDLGVLVPGLKGGGFSKSTTLSMAAEWLEQLLEGNKALAAQAEALQQR